jgi:hypothetical protein
MMAWLLNAAMAASLCTPVEAAFSPNLTGGFMFSPVSPLVQYEPPGAWYDSYSTLDWTVWEPGIVAAGIPAMASRGTATPRLTFEYPGHNVSLYGTVNNRRANTSFPGWFTIDGVRQQSPTLGTSTGGTMESALWTSPASMDFGLHNLSLGLDNSSVPGAPSLAFMAINITTAFTAAV